MLESKEAFYLIFCMALKQPLKEENLQSQPAIIAYFNKNKAALSESTSCWPNWSTDLYFMKPS